MASYRWVKSVSSIVVSLFAASAMAADVTIANGQEVMTTQSSTANSDVIIIQPNGKITADEKQISGSLSLDYLF